MKRTTAISGFILLACAAAGAQVASHAPTALNQPSAQQTAAQPAPEQPVARVNNTVLTGSDLVREEYAIFPYARQHGGLPKELAGEIRQGAMKMMVFEELVYQEALRRKMTVSPARMLQAEAQFRKQFASPDEYNTMLQTDFHGSQQVLNEKIHRSLLIDALLKTEVENRDTVSDADALAYYHKNAARFDRPEMYTFQTISVLPPQNATAAQLAEGKKRAEQAYEQAKTTKTAEAFGLLAEKLSDDDYRVVMGQHKPVPVNQLAPPVLQALQSMQPGQVSGLIQLDQAYTIVRLNVHSPAGRAKFADVKTPLEKQMKETKRNQLRASLDAELRKNAKIQEF
ncbi:MAG: peptidylprolyl isomerase [Acidobacteriaceae bacterium]